MKNQFPLAVLMAITVSTSAQEKVADYDWKVVQQMKQGALPGDVATVDGKSVLQIASSDGLQARLLVISNPPVSKKLYAITGRIKYENVSGDGYLEMWNYFPPQKTGMDEAHYFSRTLGESGEMGKIHGTSDWRDFALPFNSTGAKDRPTRLEINVVLPGKGNVELSSLKLIQYDDANLGAKSSGEWWSDRSSGWIGGIGGSIIGCFGALLGLLATRGKARTFVVASLQTMAAAGALLTIAGVVAVCLRQPYAVWFPLLLGGVILGCLVFQLPEVTRRYDELELRRMNSIDAMAS